MPQSIFLTLFASVGRSLIGYFFISTGIAKVQNSPATLLNNILQYELLSKPIAKLLSYVLPWFEITLGILLIIGFKVSFVSAIMIIALAAFAIAMTISICQGKIHDCGCGTHESPVRWSLVYRNLAMIVILVILFKLQGGTWTFDQWIVRGREDLALREMGMFIVMTVVVIGSFIAISHVRKMPFYKR